MDFRRVSRNGIRAAWDARLVEENFIFNRIIRFATTSMFCDDVEIRFERRRYVYFHNEYYS